MSDKIEVDGAFKRVFSEVQALRDGIRLQAHLFTLEARERWHELETSVEGLEQRLQQESGPGSLIAQAKLGELTHRLRDFVRLHLHRGSALEAPVRTIMSPAPRSCAPEDRLNVAAQIMWEVDCGVVPVVSHDGRALGVITDRDVCIAAYMQGEALAACSVEHAMSKGLHQCGMDTPIWNVLEIMREQRVRRVLITDDEGRLQGLASFADIARALRAVDDMAAYALLARTLAVISEPRTPLDHPVAAAAE